MWRISPDSFGRGEDLGSLFAAHREETSNTKVESNLRIGLMRAAWSEKKLDIRMNRGSGSRWDGAKPWRTLGVLTWVCLDDIAETGVSV